MGVIVDQTGPGSPEASPEFQAARAVVNYQNAHGGVDGRQIVLVPEDDASTAAGNLSAAQSLVQTKNVFMVMDVSPFGAAGAGGQWLSSNGIPVVLTPEAQALYATFFDPVGGFGANPKQNSATFGELFKQLGATKVGSLGIAVSAAAQFSAQQALGSAKLAGLRAGYYNGTVQVPTTSWSPYVLALKNSGTDGFWGVLDVPDSLSFFSALKQQGASNVKVIAANLYIDTYLTGSTESAMQGVYVVSNWLPAQLNQSASKTEESIESQYGGPSGIPDFNINNGYEDGQLLVYALQTAGQNPTRAGLISKLRKVTNWNAAGLTAQPVNFATQNTNPPIGAHGPGNCVWPLKAENGKFVPITTKAVCAPTVTVSGPTDG